MWLLWLLSVILAITYAGEYDNNNLVHIKGKLTDTSVFFESIWTLSGDLIQKPSVEITFGLLLSSKIR